VEIGTYCGKSAVYLGAAARERNTVLFTLDHHRGSEEMQSDWEHHDPEVVDARTGRMDSLPFFRRTMDEAKLDDVVIAVVGDSPTIARHWTTPVAFLFIDGGHSEHIAMADYESWSEKLVWNGLLAIHDVFEDPSKGGQGPFRVFQRACNEGYEPTAAKGSLRVLTRR
jgi:predicted O-methyltransferase YrrM